MENWKEKLDIFINDFEYMNDLIGILVCGSFITGNPTNHSDLDVHMVLDNSVDYRERGNKIINGLLIEYFANPPRQILKYFEEDVNEKSLMSQTQFATGKIILDKKGDVALLKEKALDMIAGFYADGSKIVPMSDSVKYFLWDMLDDLQDAYENNRLDFNFMYYNLLNKIISSYMRCIHKPYNFKTILGNINDSIVRKKYLLRELPDKEISYLISNCITIVDKKDKMIMIEKLVNAILDKYGGFNVSEYKLKSSLDV